MQPTKKIRVDTPQTLPPAPPTPPLQGNMRVFQNKNICNEILKNLDFKSVLSFETVAKPFSVKRVLEANETPFTEPTWKILRERDYFQFNWSDCEQEPLKERWNYLLGFHAIRYFYNQPDAHTADQVQKKYKFLITRFTNFGSYITKSIRIIKGKVVDKNLSREIQAAAKKFGGEALLIVLMDLNKRFHVKQLESCQNAVQKGATCAALLTVINSSKREMLGKEIILESAKRGDCRALEHALHLCGAYYIVSENLDHSMHYEIDFESISDQRFPPIIHYLAKTKKNLDERNALLEEALQEYKDKGLPVNIVLLIDLALAKKELKQYEKAEQLLEGVHSRIDLSNDILYEIAEIKFILEKYAQAENFIMKVLGRESSFKFFKLAIEIKIQLKKYKEAEKLFEDFRGRRQNQTQRVYYQSLFREAKLNLMLGDYKQAENLLDYFFKIFNHTSLLPDFPFSKYSDFICWTIQFCDVIVETVKIKLKFNKYDEARKLIEDALSKYGNDVSPEIAELAKELGINQK